VRLGGRDLDRGQGIALGRDENMFVTGWTSSRDFPTTDRAPSREHAGGEDAFVLRLGRAGRRVVYSTFLGGPAADRGRGIGVDARDNAFVTGATGSADFSGGGRSAHAGAEDVFVTQLDPAGSLRAGLLVGGAAVDFGRGIATQRDGTSYVAGRTESSDLPTTGPTSAAGPRGARDVVLLRIEPTSEVRSS
jgi:hypothetical protein